MALTAKKRKKMPKSVFAIPERKAYPIDTMARARNAIARVQQHGTPKDKRRVFAKVKKRFPSLAQRSGVIPTKKGPGRRVGQPPRGRAGGSSVAGTVRRRKRRGGGRSVATRKQRAAARRNIKKAQAARRRGGAGAKAGRGRKVAR